MSIFCFFAGVWLLFIGYLDWQFYRMIGVAPVVGLISIFLGAVGVGLGVGLWLTT